MYKIFYSLIVIIWVLDIINVPCLSFLDLQVPINELGWLLIWIFLPDTKKE